MKNIKIIICILILATLGIIAFGPPTQTQAAPNSVEPDQFSCTNVTEIPQSECEALVAIYNVSISPLANWLETTTPCSWSGITCESGYVAELNLSSNELNSLPAEISNLTNLTGLALGKNQLSSLPAEIGNLTNLTSLGLSSNQLSSLPAEIGNLINLTWLSLSDNELSSLPAEISNLTNLDWLSLSSNELSSLPAEIGNLTNLTGLALDKNQLSSLPAEIGNLTNLTTLTLWGNELSSLPAEIGNLTNLTRLGLYSNQLSSLPTEIDNLTNLDWLDLDFNQLSSLPAEIGNLTTLTRLDLYSNQLSSLPTEIGDLANLTTLDLNNNELSSLPAEIGNLTNLTWLTLSSNKLGSLPAEIGNLTNLATLEMAYNRLIIPDDLHSFITGHDADWLDSQTAAPANVEATVPDNDSIELTWIPIIFQEKGGYYEISVADNGSFSVHGTTTSKSDTGYVIDGLTSGTTYDIRIRTYTPAHDGVNSGSPEDDQSNELWSDYSPLISATTLVANDTPTSLTENEEPSESVLFLPLIYR